MVGGVAGLRARFILHRVCVVASARCLVVRTNRTEICSGGRSNCSRVSDVGYTGGGELFRSHRPHCVSHHNGLLPRWILSSYYIPVGNLGASQAEGQTGCDGVQWSAGKTQTNEAKLWSFSDFLLNWSAGSGDQ